MAKIRRVMKIAILFSGMAMAALFGKADKAYAALGDCGDMRECFLYPCDFIDACVRPTTAWPRWTTKSQYQGSAIQRDFKCGNRLRWSSLYQSCRTLSGGCGGWAAEPQDCTC